MPGGTANNLQEITATLDRAINTQRFPIQRNAITAWAVLVRELNSLGRHDDAREMAGQMGKMLAKLRQDSQDQLDNDVLDAVPDVLARLEPDDQARVFQSLQEQAKGYSQAAALLLRMEGRWGGGLALTPRAHLQMQLRQSRLTTALTLVEGVPLLLVAAALVLAAWLGISRLSARGLDIQYWHALPAVASALAASVAAALIARPVLLSRRWDAYVAEVGLAALVTNVVGYIARFVALLVVGIGSHEQDEPILAASLFLGLLAVRAATLSSGRGGLAIMVARGGLAGCLGVVVPFLAGLGEVLIWPERAAESNLASAWWTFLPTFVAAGMSYGWSDAMRGPTGQTRPANLVQDPGLVALIRSGAAALAGTAALIPAVALVASALRQGDNNPIQVRVATGGLEERCNPQSGTSAASYPTVTLRGVVLGWRYPVAFCSEGTAAFFTTTSPANPDLQLTWFPDENVRHRTQDDPDPPALAVDVPKTKRGTVCFEATFSTQCLRDDLRPHSLSAGDLAQAALLRWTGHNRLQPLESDDETRQYTINMTRDQTLVQNIVRGANGDEDTIRRWQPPPEDDQTQVPPPPVFRLPNRLRQGGGRP